MIHENITANILILVEGDDEKDLIEILLAETAPDWRGYFDIEKPDQLLDAFKDVYARSSKPKLKHVIVVADAEESPEKNSADFERARQNLLVKGIETTIYINPNSTEKGSLESALIRVFQADPMMTCAHQLISCAESSRTFNTTAQRDVIQFFAWIALRVSPHKPFSRLGVALKQDAELKLAIVQTHYAQEKIKFFKSLMPQATHV
jgi:hypothetical protein